MARLPLVSELPLIFDPKALAKSLSQRYDEAAGLSKKSANAESESQDLSPRSPKRKKFIFRAPTVTKRSLPQPVPAKSRLQAARNTRTVLGSLLSIMDSGQPLSDAIPVVYRRKSTDAPLRRETFAPLDPELKRELDERIARDVEARKLARQRELDETVEMPASPGKEYDKLFIPAEIGVRKPEFSVIKHAHMFRGVKNKSDLKKLLEQASQVEKSLQQRYKRYSCPELVAKGMLRQHLLDRKRARKTRKGERTALEDFDVNSSPGSE